MFCKHKQGEKTLRNFFVLQKSWAMFFIACNVGPTDATNVEIHAAIIRRSFTWISAYYFVSKHAYILEMECCFRKWYTTLSKMISDILYLWHLSINITNLGYGKSNFDIKYQDLFQLHGLKTIWMIIFWIQWNSKVMATKERIKISNRAWLNVLLYAFIHTTLINRPIHDKNLTTHSSWMTSQQIPIIMNNHSIE